MDAGGGVARCGRWSARGTGPAVELSADSGEVDGQDRAQALDALRALCVACWNTGVSAVVGADDAAPGRAGRSRPVAGGRPGMSSTVPAVTTADSVPPPAVPGPVADGGASPTEGVTAPRVTAPPCHRPPCRR